MKLTKRSFLTTAIFLSSTLAVAAEAKRLDLLLMIDNSGSMSAYQDKLAPKLETLLTHLATTNWRIAVATTDDSCLRDLITKKQFTNDPVAATARFAMAVNAGSGGKPLERGLEMSARALSGKCASGNLKWTRNQSTKATLILSNEDNCGTAANEFCDPVYGPSEFLAAAPAETVVYALLHDLDACESDGYDIASVEYHQVVAATGGLRAPICQPSYEGILREISRHLKNRIDAL